ncbi:MAG: site-specific tyrosine recombinase XerD [Chlorobi bacterium]|nr:site-specific tyrosine recombinase XerD [Chlorobiota bacterium]
MTQPTTYYWEDLLGGYRSYLKLEKSVAAPTVEAYNSDVSKFIRYLEATGREDLTAADITADLLREFITEISKLGIGPRTQARLISGIKSFFKYLFLENILTLNPAELLESPKIGRKLPEVLTVGEIDKIIGTIDLSHPQGQRNKAMLETLYSCGLRVSELVDLRISNLYFNEGFIKVTGKGSKERLVPISYRAIREIERYIPDRNHLEIDPAYEDILFLNRLGRKLTRVMIFTIIKDLSLKTGIKKTVSPHTFRHSFATHLMEGGADLRAIQEMLGHESIQTTEIYTHMDKDYLRSTILEFHPRA